MDVLNTLIWTILGTSIIYRNNVVHCVNSPGPPQGTTSRDLSAKDSNNLRKANISPESVGSACSTADGSVSSVSVTDDNNNNIDDLNSNNNNDNDDDSDENDKYVIDDDENFDNGCGCTCRNFWCGLFTCGIYNCVKHCKSKSKSGSTSSSKNNPKSTSSSGRTCELDVTIKNTSTTFFCSKKNNKYIYAGAFGFKFSKVTEKNTVIWTAGHGESSEEVEYDPDNNKVTINLGNNKTKVFIKDTDGKWKDEKSETGKSTGSTGPNSTGGGGSQPTSGGRTQTSSRGGGSTLGGQTSTTPASRTAGQSGGQGSTPKPAANQGGTKPAKPAGESPYGGAGTSPAKGTDKSGTTSGGTQARAQYSGSSSGRPANQAAGGQAARTATRQGSAPGTAARSGSTPPAIGAKSGTNNSSQSGSQAKRTGK